MKNECTIRFPHLALFGMLLGISPMLQAAEQGSGTLIIISSLGVWTLFIMVPWLIVRSRKGLMLRLSRFIPGRKS